MNETEDPSPGPETVSLGRFDPLELPLILDALREHGIFALTKSPLDRASTEQYTMFDHSRQTLLVDRTRVDEARRIIESEVRPSIGEMRATIDDDADIDFEAQGLVPIGWLEPEVARELLRLLADRNIKAASEYPLDAPAPSYARADGRVRVHVEEQFVTDALAVLENDVPPALALRGIVPAEPLVGEDE